MTTREVATTTRPGEVAKREPGETVPLSVSPAYVQETIKSLALLQGMTRDLLKRGRDYGRTPGTASDGLWDPGASLIIAGFNCYAGQRRVLSLIDQEDKISLIVEVPLINRLSGEEVGSGVGAASTLETKYKYRWLYESELKELGYTPEQITSLKTSKKHPGKYRVDNMERGELLNTLVKQASKRGEVDAAEALPGVASVLREMFDPEKQGGRGKGGEGEGGEEYQGARWQRYWGEVRRLGYTDQEMYAKLGVQHMKDWLARGRSLDEALDVLRGKKPAGAGNQQEGGSEGSPGEGEGTGEGDGPGEGREYDKTMVRSAAGKLKWDAKRLNKELEERFNSNSMDDMPDDKLHEAASKLCDLAEAS